MIQRLEEVIHLKISLKDKGLNQSEAPQSREDVRFSTHTNKILEMGPSFAQEKKYTCEWKQTQTKNDNRKKMIALHKISQ